MILDRKIELLVCDLDNTLVAPPERRLMPRTLQVLRELTAGGLAFTVATGRTWPSFRPFYENLPVNAPLVLMNGACVFDPLQQQDLAAQPLHPQDALGVVDRAKAAGLHVNCYHDHRLLYEHLTPRAVYTCEKEKLMGEAVGDLTPFLEQGPAKLLLVGEPAELAVFRRDYRQISDGEGVRMVFSEPDYLEVLHTGASKFTALQALCGLIDVDMAGVLAFGDNENDLEMVRDCGVGVAVETGHDTVRQAARFTCPGPQDEGVAAWLSEAFEL